MQKILTTYKKILLENSIYLYIIIIGVGTLPIVKHCTRKNAGKKWFPLSFIPIAMRHVKLF